MTWISRAAGLYGFLLAACVFGPGASPAGACDVLAACAGMELAGGGSPKVDSPDGNLDTGPGTAPHDDKRGHEPRAHGDNDNDGGGTGSDQASPPDFVQPPGCIFREAPLELIV